MSDIEKKIETRLRVLFLAMGFCFGGLIFDGLEVGEPELHTEKSGCEYVEKMTCVAVWVKANHTKVTNHE